MRSQLKSTQSCDLPCIFHLHLRSSPIMLPSNWLAVPTCIPALDCAVYDDSGTGELALPEFVEALVAAGGCDGSYRPCLRPGVVLFASSGLQCSMWMQLPCVQSPVVEQLTSEWQGRPLQATATRKLRRCFKLLMQTTGVSLSIRRCSINDLCSSIEVEECCCRHSGCRGVCGVVLAQ